MTWEVAIMESDDMEGTVSVVVEGGKAVLLAAFLIEERGTSFSVAPLPDDKYEFRFEAEHGRAVKRKLQEIAQTFRIVYLATGNRKLSAYISAFSKRQAIQTLMQNEDVKQVITIEW